MNTLIAAAIRCSLMFATAATFCVTHPAKANLITNGGFETGDFTGWEALGGRLAFVSGTFNGIAPHSGNYQAVLGGARAGGKCLSSFPPSFRANLTRSTFGWPTLQAQNREEILGSF